MRSRALAFVLALTAAALGCALRTFAARSPAEGVYINELLADNDTVIPDEWMVYVPLTGLSMRPPSLPLRLNCGSEKPYTTLDGRVFLADRAWDSGAAYGYLGGYADLPTDWWEFNPVGGTVDDKLYKTQRVGWEEYRVSHIPNGSYLVTLHFQEQRVHGPGLSVFGVSAENQALLVDFDVWGEVERYYALDRRLAVQVDDHELNVTAAPVVGEPALAALELVPREPDSTLPAVPTGLASTPSYGAVLLDWADAAEDDLAGYHVYRAYGPWGEFHRLTVDGPAPISRFQDGIAANVPHYYAVSAIDVYGNESALSDPVVGVALDWEEAALPLYQLAVTPENLAVLYANIWSDDRVPAEFTWQGQTLAAEVRFRGGMSRTVNKKSWKIVFDDEDSPFPNHDRINVNANWFDPSLIRAKLSNDLFDAVGLRPPQAELVLLSLNGGYRGVYTRNEQVDEGFLATSGRNPDASVYKVVDRFAEILPDEQAYRAYYEKETNEDLPYDDLIAFIELINYTPDDQFAAALAQVMDVEAFLDHYAIIVLTANFDSATHNLYLVHDLETDLWELVPWDLDAGFSCTECAVDLGTEQHPEARGWNILRTRVLQVPEFRSYYCQRLQAYMDSIFSDAVLYPQVDALHDAIRDDGVRDWLKFSWEDSAPLTYSPVVIKEFITEHKAVLQDQMADFCPAD